jgi:hypothetical protein
VHLLRQIRQHVGLEPNHGELLSHLVGCARTCETQNNPSAATANAILDSDY